MSNSQPACPLSCSQCTFGNLSSTCNCDPECSVFQDCCNTFHPSHCPKAPFDRDIATECHSSFVNKEASRPDTDAPVYVVTSCPASPNTDKLLESKCVNQTIALPPVTDLDTGVVYKNEDCALCNGATSLQAWQVNLVCTDNVYNLLANFTLERVLGDDPNIFSTSCTDCSYLSPTLPAGTRQPRLCTPRISKCLSKEQIEAFTKVTLTDHEYAEMQMDCQAGPLNLVRSDLNRVYRNQACAQCNLVYNPTCYEDETDRNGNIPLCNPITNGVALPPSMLVYSITLSNLGSGQVRVMVTSQTSELAVSCPEGEAPIGLECRPTQCPEGYLETGGRCGASQAVTSNHSSNSTPPVVPTIDCPTALLALNVSEFEDRGNGTIFFEGEVLQVNFYDNSGRPLVCPDNVTLVTVNTTVISLLPGIAELSYIGCSLSVLGTILIFLTYGLFAELRTLPSLLLMNLALAILLANLTLIIGGPIVQQFPRVDLCASSAIFLHFFFLAQFVWMTLFSIEMAHSFQQAKKMVAVSNKKKGRVLLAYLLIGWGLPLAICTVTIGLNFSGRGLVLYGVTSDGRVGICWINHFVSLVVSFVLPLCISQSINLLLLVLVTVFLCHSVRNKSTQQKTDYIYLRLMRVWLAPLASPGSLVSWHL